MKTKKTEKEALSAFYRVVLDMTCDLVNDKVIRGERLKYWTAPMLKSIHQSKNKCLQGVVEPDYDERIDDYVDEIKSHHNNVVKEYVDSQYVEVCTYCIMLSEMLGICNLMHVRFFGKKCSKINKAFEYLVEAARHIPGLITKVEKDGRIDVADDFTNSLYVKILTVIFEEYDKL